MLLDNIKKANLVLPKVSTPGGNYKSVNIRGKIAYISIQFPILNEEYLYQGRLGKELSTDQGYAAMQLCALNVLSQIHYKIGEERLEGINHIDAYYQQTELWDEAPKVVNGASDTLIAALGSKGEHSRAIFGVANLPRNFSVGLCVSATLV